MHNALSRAEPGCGVAATSCQAACSGTIQYGATAPMAALKAGTHGFDCLWDAVYHKLTTGAQEQQRHRLELAWHSKGGHMGTNGSSAIY